MWNKLLTPTLIVALALIFSLTWYISIKAEDYFSLWVERSNQYAPALVTTELTNYERGFFSAAAVTTIGVKDLGEIDFHHLIRHYLWGATVITTPVLTADTPADLAGLRIVTDIGPTGTARSRLSLPQLTLDTGVGPALKLERIAVEGRVNADASAGSWDLNLAQFQLDLDEEHGLIFAGIHSAADLTRLDHFPLGQSHTRISSVRLHRGTPQPLQMENLSFTGSNLVSTDQRYLSRTELSFATLQAGADTLANGRLALALTDLDPQLIAVVTQARQDLRRRVNSGALTAGDLMEEMIVPLYHALLQSGLTLALEQLNLETSGGQLTANGRGLLKAGASANDPRALLEQLELQLQVDFDVVILARIQQMLETFSGTGSNLSRREEELRLVFGGLAQLGFLTRLEGDRFRLQLAYDEGEISLNGLPFRLF